MIRNEFTWTAVLLGLILSVVMGAANVYLGLRAGMTVSASIPAAVIAMGIYSAILRRRSILEANLVQTGASAGESLAAGIIFTMPAMILAGIWDNFDFWATSLIALSGGLLGVLFMIPMRKVFVVDSPELKFPEGLACAAVLKSGDQSNDNMGTAAQGTYLVFMGLAIGAVFKFLSSFLGIIKSNVEWATTLSSRVFYIGSDISPALVSVGIIVGLPISAQIFMGGAIGWLIVIPCMGYVPQADTIVDSAYTLWSTQVRYIGVGTMVVGGIVSIWRVRMSLVRAVTELISQFNNETSKVEIEDDNLSGLSIALLSIACVMLIFGIYHWFLNESIGITVLITLIMIIMSFFFTAVASYIVGLVGNSNSPVSGMTITSILVTALIIHWVGYSGVEGMIATLGVAGVVCCVACTSGDVCNDLKTGYLVHAKPRNQQIMQILAVLVAAFVMAPIMSVLHQGSINNGTGGIGGRELPAPQAVLFSELVKGFFGDGSLPITMVIIGICIGLLIWILDYVLYVKTSSFRLHIMPVAVGIYLPFGLAMAIMLGGIVSYLLSDSKSSESSPSQNRGVLAASGIIAGESLIGVLLGFLAYYEIKSYTILSSLHPSILDVISIVALLSVVLWIYWQSKRENRVLS